MFSYNEAFYDLKSKLQPLYDEREAVAIAHEVMYHITGLDKTQRLVQKEKYFTEQQQEQYTAALAALNTGTPLQYVTGSAWFMGREYHVNNHVLIPRPETEELVQWIIDDYKGRELNILDIGTGSGCIPISLQLALPGITITSCDISADALAVAKTNADSLSATVHLLQIDFLDTEQHTKLGTYNVIVSNPPYIPMADRQSMHTNVKDHEPSIALFVPDHDALLFYRTIALFGHRHLSMNGYIYCELDTNHAMRCKELFEKEGYTDVVIKADMHGNLRMLRARSEP